MGQLRYFLFSSQSHDVRLLLLVKRQLLYNLEFVSVVTAFYVF